MTDRHAPWERQEGESAKAFAAFCAYRDTPAVDRNLEKMRREGVKSVSRWRVRWQWAKRAGAWDDERDRLAREAQAAEVKEMNRRHAQMAMGLIQAAAERLRDLDPSTLTPSDVRQYFIEAAKLERLARGEADSVMQQRGTVTFKVVHEDGVFGVDDGDA